MDLLALKDIAIHAALAAGTVIQNYLKLDNHNIRVEKKISGTSYASQVVTEVDLACEKAILFHILPTCDKYDLALLSEETEDDGSRFEKDYFWCIDPLDGTLPFINKQPGFSVSIALVAKDGTPQIGVVFDPGTNNLYHAAIGHGVYKNKKGWKIKNDHHHLTYVTDRKLSDTPQAARIENILKKHTVSLGLDSNKEMAGAGSVLNAIRVLENGPACMLKPPKKQKGGGSTWDFAATVCIYHELGLPATDFSGGKLDLNKKGDTFMNINGIFFGNLNTF